MKNKEKFSKEIFDIACRGDSIAITITNNEIVPCESIECEKCIFKVKEYEECSDKIKKWCESEYIEKPTLTSKEKKFLDLLLPKWKYMARGADKNLYVFDSLPIKGHNGWCIENISMCEYCYISKKLFDNMFNFIKWKDEKSWSIEDLKKLEVKDE